LLVLTRRNQEWLRIRTPAGDINVMVLEIAPGKVRLGIDAPNQYTILRSELITNGSEPDLRGGIEE
jgi:carbon storage regulator CsrA